MKQIWIMLGLLVPGVASAGPCEEPGEGQQWVIAESGSEVHQMWRAFPGEIHPIDLANGFRAGVSISTVELDFYEERWKEQDAVPEIVRLQLYDLTGESPVQLTRTYGGTNSLQAYTSNGGATRVEEFGDEGLHLQLLKPHCVSVESLTD